MRVWYKYIYVVLVYKNIDVLRNFFTSIQGNNFKVIVVNSFYDEKTLVDCRSVAEDNCADFISVPNKGYGYGNNVGVKYAMKYYDYDFLIISNSDILIKSIDSLEEYSGSKMIIAPDTVMPSGKHQNPDTPWELVFIYPLLSLALNSKIKLLYMLCHVCTRTTRELFRLYSFVVRKRKYKIFSAHGSFIIFTKSAVEFLFPFFDDDMFLYNEEWYLAVKAKEYGVPIYYVPSIDVLHLEGASSGAVDYSDHDRLSFNIFNDKRKKGLIK